MRTLVLFVVTLVFGVSLSMTSFGQTAKDVIVANPPASPVNIRAVDDPAKRAFQLAFEVGTPNPVSTPAGKIFVVEHVSGTFRLGTVSGSSNPCRFLQIAFPASGASGPFEALELIPTVMGTAQSIGQDLTFISINHSMKFYVRPNTEVGGLNYVMGGNCTGAPLVNSRMVLSGHLVDQ